MSIERHSFMCSLYDNDGVCAVIDYDSNYVEEECYDASKCLKKCLKYSITVKFKY